MRRTQIAFADKGRGRCPWGKNTANHRDWTQSTADSQIGHRDPVP